MVYSGTFISASKCSRSQVSVNSRNSRFCSSMRSLTKGTKEEEEVLRPSTLNRPIFFNELVPSSAISVVDTVAAEVLLAVLPGDSMLVESERAEPCRPGRIGRRAQEAAAAAS